MSVSSVNDNAQLKIGPSFDRADGYTYARGGFREMHPPVSEGAYEAYLANHARMIAAFVPKNS